MSRRDGFHVSISVHPGSANFNASLAETSLGQRIFSSSQSEQCLAVASAVTMLVDKNKLLPITKFSHR